MAHGDSPGSQTCPQVETSGAGRNLLSSLHVEHSSCGFDAYQYPGAGLGSGPRHAAGMPETITKLRGVFGAPPLP